MLKRFMADARFYFRLKFPDDKPRPVAIALCAIKSPGMWFLTLHRIGFYASKSRNLKNPVWWLARLIEFFAHYILAIAGKCEIRADCCFEGDVYLSDKGYLVFGAFSVGDGTLIHDHVSSGYGVADGNLARPVIGRNVWIGPNCIVVGGLTIGDGATLMPGTFVTTNVAPNCVMYGNPARVLRRNFDNTALRQSLAVVQDLPKEMVGA